MMESKHDFHEQIILLDLLHDCDMQRTSWNIADNLDDNSVCIFIQ